MSSSTGRSTKPSRWWALGRTTGGTGRPRSSRPKPTPYYKRELTAGEAVRVTIQLIDYDDKRLHFYQEARHAAEGWVAATCENLSLHVDMATRRVAPFPGDILDNLAVMWAAHARLKTPEALGRVMGLRHRPLRERSRASGVQA